ncbi:MAG TPA: SDR family oxidoreductase [Burkholderiales bacterium]|nr:SDR family oxidoreductase [Burkholderiales bacterium]
MRGDALEGKAALITGGASGLGLAMARRFATLGCRLALVGRSASRLEGAARSIGGAVEVFTRAADVRDPTALDAAVGEAEAAIGPLDILVNNAAGNFLALTEELSPNAFNAVVQTVLYGTFHATTAVGRRMIESGRGGSVLNVLATYAWTGSAFVVPSAVAKAGVLAMTRSLAVEWATYGIRTNAIAPGPFPTEGARARLLPTPELEAQSLARIPMGRFGRPAELAELAAFLVSDAAPYINGECITIDGGGWLTSGLFNALTAKPRAEVKAMFEEIRTATQRGSEA